MDKSVCWGRVNGIIAPPSSKSYAQRAIALSLRANGRSELRNREFCKDFFRVAAEGMLHAFGKMNQGGFLKKAPLTRKNLW